MGVTISREDYTHATFYKPVGIRYTDMAIYIDNHPRETATEEDKAVIYKYLYLMFKTQIYHQHIKRVSRDPWRADACSLFAAIHIYMRWADTSKEPIKSSSNFIKATLRYYIHQYFDEEESSEADNFNRKLDNKLEKGLDIEGDCRCMDFYHANDWMHDNIFQFNSAEAGVYIDGFCDSVYKFLKTTPHKSKYELECIYTSCILSLLSFTTVYVDRVSVMRMKRSGRTTTKRMFCGNGNGSNAGIPERLCDSWTEDRNIVLFGLPESMHDYIYMLVREIRAMLVEELNYVTNSAIFESQLLTMYDDDEYEEEY